MTEMHLVHVHASLVKEVPITVLSNRQFCVVLDPVIDGKQRIGAQELRQGERKFFLQPGESLRDGIEEVFVLGEDEALLLRCEHQFDDTSPSSLLSPSDAVLAKTADTSDNDDSASPSDNAAVVARSAGETWMIYGPCECVNLIGSQH